MERYTIPALIMIVSLGIFFGFIRGTYAKIEQGIKQKEEIVNYLEQAKSAKDKLDKLSNTVNSFPPDAEKKLAVMIPETIDEVTFYMQFQELMKNSGVIFNNMSAKMGGGKKEDGFVTNQMVFTVEATYPTFKKFLYVLEKSLALREMGSISFTTKSKEASSANPLRGAYRSEGPEVDTHSYSIIVSSFSMK